jgi:hypothetical protein
MNRVSLPDRIELDGAVELLRCPDFRQGWSASDIRVTQNPETWRLPDSYRHLGEAWDLRNAGERSDPKVALREFRVDSGSRLVCQLQATEWREVRPLHERPRLREDEILACRPPGCAMLVPNMGVVHVVASTSDGWLLAFRRSEQAHYHPGAWSATYEEGLAPEDALDNAVFQRAARRGLAEEVTPQASSVALEAFRVAAIVLERPLGNPAAVVVADLPFTRQELPAQLPSDELDSGSVVTVPIDEPSLRKLIMEPTFVWGSQRGAWHPTARYRILAAMTRFFGEQIAADILSRLER